MDKMDKTEMIHRLELHQMWLETVGKEGKQLTADEVDFRDIILSNYSLSHTSLTGCVFDEMVLTNKDLSAALLCSSTFKNAKAEKSDYYKADVAYADFTQANLQEARFVKCDCSETIFSKANLTNANLVNSTFYLTDFRDAILCDVDISASLFEEVLLKGADLKGIRGLEDSHIESINIGTPEDKVLLKKEEARQWILKNANKG